MTSDIPDFDAVTNFEEGGATVVLRGTVENRAAFELAAILDAAIDRHPTSVVLDVSALDFMKAARVGRGLQCREATRDHGVTLMVQSPSALVNRLLGLMEAAELSRLERNVPARSHLGPEQLGGLDVVAQRFGSSLSVRDLRRITGMPADPDVVNGALGLVVELARSSIADADGASVSLMRNGVLSTVTASDQTIMTMDADQYATGEGPCVDASVKGHWFHAESLDTETRWPAFTPRARALGIKAILSSPLRSFAQPVGALNIYSRRASTFEIKDQEAAVAFAQKASVILGDAHMGVTDREMALRFQEALRTREIISLAKGIVMASEGVDEDHAFTVLLRSSLEQGMTIRGQAEAMVNAARRRE